MDHSATYAFDGNWWRPAPAAIENEQARYGSRVAFGCLVAFSVILLLAPQSFVPALKVIRVALLTAGFGIVIHVCDATVHRRPLIAATPELILALALLGWSIFTIPFSMWPGGSLSVISDQYVKAIV